MQNIGVGEVKAQFSSILHRIAQGEEFAITFGKRKSRLAVLIPFSNYQTSQPQRRLGVLSRKGSFRVSKNFKMTDEEFLGS